MIGASILLSRCTMVIVVGVGCALLPGCTAKPSPVLAVAPALNEKPGRDLREIKCLDAATQLTFDFEAVSGANFSADMKWAIFRAIPKGETRYQIYVARLNIQSLSPISLLEPCRVSPLNTRNCGGVFSPSGTNILFASAIDISKAGDLEQESQSAGDRIGPALSDAMAIYSAADWPSGTPSSPRIAYTEIDEPASGGHQFNLAIPANRLTARDSHEGEFSFSPDGRWIAVSSQRSGEAKIWIMKSDGSRATQVTHAAGYDRCPCFTPDGKRLLFQRDRERTGRFHIVIAGIVFDAADDIVGTKNEQQLTDTSVIFGLCPHPDNRHIIFAADTLEAENDELYVMRMDGTHKARLSYWPGFDGQPALSPDGKLLMWSSQRTADGPLNFLSRDISRLKTATPTLIERGPRHRFSRPTKPSVAPIAPVNLFNGPAQFHANIGGSQEKSHKAIILCNLPSCR